MKSISFALFFISILLFQNVIAIVSVLEEGESLDLSPLSDNNEPTEFLETEIGVRNVPQPFARRIAQQIGAWNPPIVYTRTQMRRAAGHPGRRCSFDELACLAATNHAIVSGRVDSPAENDLTLLRTNWQVCRQQRREFPSRRTACNLDGERACQPIEDFARTMVIAAILSADGNAQHRNLRTVYNSLVSSYEHNQASIDARGLYNAFRFSLSEGNTDEPAIWRILGGKTRDQVAAINRKYVVVCRGQNTAMDTSGGHTALYNALLSELSGGDEEKAIDLYSGRPARSDEHYYWWSALLHSTNRRSEKDLKNWRDHWWNIPRIVGAFEMQALIQTSQGVNTLVREAQQFWLETVQDIDESICQSEGTGVKGQIEKTGRMIPCLQLKAGAYIMFGLATLGGSLGTRAFDPTLPYDEGREGLYDLALWVVTFGAGKILTGAGQAVKAGAVGTVNAASAIATRVGPIVSRLARNARALRNFSRVPWARILTSIRGFTSQLNTVFRNLFRSSRVCRVSFLETGTGVGTGCGWMHNFIQSTKTFVADITKQNAHLFGEQVTAAQTAVERAARLASQAEDLARVSSSADEVTRAATEANNAARAAEEALGVLQRTAGHTDEGIAALRSGMASSNPLQNIVRVGSQSFVEVTFSSPRAANTAFTQVQQMAQLARANGVQFPSIARTSSGFRAEITPFLSSTELTMNANAGVARSLAQSGTRIGIDDAYQFLAACQREGLNPQGVFSIIREGSTARYVFIPTGAVGMTTGNFVGRTIRWTQQLGMMRQALTDLGLYQQGARAARL